ncbi:MAG: Zinc ribbon domain protein [Planctomycetes bacterium ADurb.Bin126]|mgnify:FL=1|nr:MAG: Zinc ribbon domain protein [Planctomycetes bacterium ADurb.Bin126]HOD83501.1 zinc ribbon domain-containing protein [Phycisphaerae bacterium]HQL75268.1 zinc ribbon domain-containing protein [Phycisphaerae bacterium]
MPTYDYECQACKHTFEKFQSITAKPIRKCPECGKSKVRRLLGTGAGIIFKGSGFYQTDYRSRSYKQAAEKDKAPSSAPAASSSDKSSSADKGSAGASSTTSAKSDAKPAADKK